MENQHRKIQGYRDLSAEEVAAMNKVKATSAGVGAICLELRGQFQQMPVGTVEERAERLEALRWLEAGELQLQQGFMAITRGIARPTTF